MFDIVYTKRGLKVNAVWFGKYTPETVENSPGDIVFFHGIDDPGLKNSLVIPQKTLITDLRAPVDDIFAGFSSACRNSIHKAERAGVTASFYNASDIKNSPELLTCFRRDFDEFSRVKGIENLFNESAMTQYIDEGTVLLTKALYEGDAYAQHVYISDGESARLLHSVSNFRNQTVDKNLAGHANRFLHWQEMQYMKSRGFRTYDLGGLTDEQNPNGVDFFKMGFHGRVTAYNNVLVGKTIKGKASILVLTRLWRRRGII
jgi:hypothetical protein